MQPGWDHHFPRILPCRVHRGYPLREFQVPPPRADDPHQSHLQLLPGLGAHNDGVLALAALRQVDATTTISNFRHGLLDLNGMESHCKVLLLHLPTNSDIPNLDRILL